VLGHHPHVCRRRGSLPQAEDPVPAAIRLIGILPITSLLIKLLQRLVCLCCFTSTCAPLPADEEASAYGTSLSALVGQLGKPSRCVDGPWIVLDREGIEPTIKAADDERFSTGGRAQRQSVMRRKTRLAFVPRRGL
jgi:hypothetical protein